jgi:hypothetical protein
MVTCTLTYKLSNIITHIEDIVLVKPNSTKKHIKEVNNMYTNPCPMLADGKPCNGNSVERSTVEVKSRTLNKYMCS